MIQLEQICVEPGVPEFACPHPKAEMIWPQQYPPVYEPAIKA